MPDWREGISQFAERVSIAKSSDILERPTFSWLAPPPYSRQLDSIEWVYWAACATTQTYLNSFRVYAKSFPPIWNDGNFLLCGLTARAALEITGAIQFIFEGIDQPNSKLLSQTERFRRLLLGASGEIRLPMGERSDLRPINVMEFVRALDRINPRLSDDYEWLCNAAHPCSMQHTYFLMAGPILDNWENEKFAAHALEDLDRLLMCFEASISIVSAKAKSISELSKNALEDLE